MSHLLSLSSLPSPLLSFTPSTPFYSISSLSLALIFYFSSIFGLQHHMSTRPAISSNNPLLKWPFLVHNLVLSAGSGVLLFLMLQEVGPILWKRGAWGSVCDRASWTPVSILLEGWWQGKMERGSVAGRARERDRRSH